MTRWPGAVAAPTESLDLPGSRRSQEQGRTAQGLRECPTLEGTQCGQVGVTLPQMRPRLGCPFLNGSAELTWTGRGREVGAGLGSAAHPSRNRVQLSLVWGVGVGDGHLYFLRPVRSRGEPWAVRAPPPGTRSPL